MYTLKVTSFDQDQNKNTAESTTFSSQDSAVIEAHEECQWENTISAIVTDSNNEIVFELEGSFV